MVQDSGGETLTVLWVHSLTVRWAHSKTNSFLRPTSDHFHHGGNNFETVSQHQAGKLLDLVNYYYYSSSLLLFIINTNTPTPPEVINNPIYKSFPGGEDL